MLLRETCDQEEEGPTCFTYLRYNVSCVRAAFRLPELDQCVIFLICDKTLPEFLKLRCRHTKKNQAFRYIPYSHVSGRRRTIPYRMSSLSF